MHGSEKAKALTALRKTRGMVDKLIKMVEEDAYCVDVATQVNASMGLLKGVNLSLLENHLACCGPKFLNAKDPKTQDAFIKELVRARNVSNK